MKLKLLFTLLLASFFTLAQVPTNGLVKEYLFTGGSLASTVQTPLQAGTVNLISNGSSVNDNDRFQNSLPVNANAKNLNGSILYCGSTASANVQNYAFSFWMKADENDGYARTILHQLQVPGTGNGNVGSFITLVAGRLQFQTYVKYNPNSAVSNHLWNSYPTPFNYFSNSPYQWHHIVLNVETTLNETPNGSDTTYELIVNQKVYIDNYLESNITNNVVATLPTGTFTYQVLDPSKGLIIGNQSTVSSPLLQYRDVIDDIRYYETSLSESDVDALFHENVTPGPIYVDASATGTMSGNSWSNAYTTLWDAIVLNPFKKEVWVKAGTYKFPGQQYQGFEFLSHGKFYGGFDGTETSLNQRNPETNITVISGDTNGNDSTNPNDIIYNHFTRNDNKYHTIILDDGVHELLIDGFTISGGNANGTIMTTGSNQFYRTRGGAIQVLGKNISENISATFRNCIFQHNTGFETGVFGVYYNSNAPQVSYDVNFENCIFRNNHSNSGSAILHVGSISNQWVGNGEIVNCLFHDNVSVNGPAAVYLFASTAGGGPTQLGLDVNIVNSTFSKNRGGIISGGPNQVLRFDNASNCGFYNNILFGNATNGNQSSIQTFYSPNISQYPTMNANITEGYSSGTNVNVNPLFNTDFTLQSSSPAINSGNNTYLSSLYATDLSGNNRFVGTVDKGAYEYDAALSNSDFNLSNDFIVYPNPVSETLYIQTEEKIKKITLYSLDGRKLIENYSNSIHVKELPSGIFLVTIETENGKINNQRIIKK